MWYFDIISNNTGIVFFIFKLFSNVCVVCVYVFFESFNTSDVLAGNDF